MDPVLAIGKLGIVGCGKMAGALLERWLAAGTVGPADVACATARPESAAAVTMRFGVACGTEVGAVVRHADVVVVGCKPAQIGIVLAEAAPWARAGQLWVSLLAGTPIRTFEHALPPGVAVARAMPNTPARIGLGVVALSCGAGMTPAALARVEGLLRAAGGVVALAEDRMDAFTAVAGSGPAYLFRFLEGLADAAVAQGFAPDLARELALQVALGAVELARRDGRPPAALRAEVTSRGGTTEAALAELARRGWTEALVAAVGAAADRSRELAEPRAG